MDNYCLTTPESPQSGTLQHFKTIDELFDAAQQQADLMSMWDIDYDGGDLWSY